MSTKSDSTPAIYLTMACIMRDIQAVGKDQKNTMQGYNFRGIDDVMNALHPIFSAHGLFVLPMVQKLERQEMEKNAKGNASICTHLTVCYRFTSATDGSFVEATVIGEGTDYADKSTAKAMTAAYKSCLLQTFLIPTKDIEDGDIDATIEPHESLRRENERCTEEDKAKFTKLGIDPSLAEEHVSGANPPESKPEHPAQTQEKPKKGQQKAATPPPEPEKSKSAPTPPPASERAAKPKKEAEWMAYVITQVQVPRFKGRRLDDFTFDELTDVMEIWAARPEYVEKRAADPEKNAAKIHEAKMITLAFEARKKEQ